MQDLQPVAAVSLMHCDREDGHHRWPPGTFGAAGGNTLLVHPWRTPRPAALASENGQQVTAGTVHEVPASAAHDTLRTVTRFPRPSMQGWQGKRPVCIASQ
jgi:hypothetical protein